MSYLDFLALLPFIVLGATGVLVLLLAAIWRNHATAAWLTAAGLAASAATLWPAASVAPRNVTSLLIVDRFALVYTGLALLGALAVVAMAFGYLKSRREVREEFYVLLVLATLGSVTLVTSRHFASLLVGLSILSVALYGLVAYNYSNVRSLEAGLKYLVLAAAATGFLVFGIALVYFETGTLDIEALGAGSTADALDSPRVLAGLSLILVGLGLELGAAPFYQWTPDVYEGAPAPVTGFIATVPKVAVFGLLVRTWAALGAPSSRSLTVVLSCLAVASMFVGNLLALRQNNLKRLLGYSSIAHVGYVFVALLAAGPLATEAVTFYLVSYVLTNLGAFAVIASLSNAERDRDDIRDYHGLAWRHPWLAAALVAMLLSLAGLPLTAGFIGKYYLVAAGVSRDLWALVIVLIVNSVVGLYYYLRVVVAVFAASVQNEPGFDAPTTRSFALAGTVALGALSVLVVWLGIAPSRLIDFIASTVGPLR